MKKSIKTLLTVALPTLLNTSFNAHSVELNEMIQVHKSDGTYIKVSTAQSSTLSDSQKCLLGDKDLMQFSILASAANNHVKVTLPRTYPGCGLKEGYLYNDHISTNINSFTVFVPSILKKSTADATSLPAADKCDMPTGFYRVTGSPELTNGHYKVTLENGPSCGFSTGYVSSAHSIKGVRGITLRSSAWFKTSTANSSTLPDSDKCLVPAGDYVRDGFMGDKDDHYWVKLASTPPGCSFREGYIYYFNTTFEQPQATGSIDGNYAWPEPNSALGSAWCACRSVGSSPHIGQDFVKSGAKSAVAVHDGKIISKTFSSSCGHIVQLEDNAGGIWRYVHLNSPFFNVGATVKKGQKLADISAYPRSGCGTGPHLHFERRSAGAFNDSSVGKSCQNGFRTCYYDPIKPWRKSSSNNALAKLASKRTQNNNLIAPTLSDERYQDQQNDKLVVSLTKGGKHKPLHQTCKVHPEHYAKESMLRVAKFSELDAQSIKVDAQLIEKQGQLVLDVNAQLLGNANNRCGLNSAQQQDCITSWSAVAQQADGTTIRLFHDASVRNQAVKRVAAENFCLPAQASHNMSFLFTLASGKKIRVNRLVAN